ncbi:MAG: hypothetical protein HOE83_23380 [Alphaproteobacteria bacterium]|nr:hypothetical protein [Alphaproteobacteria bacterium]
MSNEPAEKIMSFAKQWVMKYESFFSMLLMGLKEEIIETGTMATNGKNLQWCPAFVLEIGRFGATFVVLHEILHVVLFHNLRRGTRDPKLWNIAADHYINLILTIMGMVNPVSTKDAQRFGTEWFRNQTLKSEAYRMPVDGIMDVRFLEMTVDHIYRVLEQEQAQGNTPEPCPWGEVEDGEGDMSPEAIDAAEKKVVEATALAASLAKSRGQFPDTLGDAIDGGREASQDWTDLLEDFMAPIALGDPSYSVQNIRMPNSAFVHQGRTKDGIGNVAIFTDASGSVSQPEFEQFMSDALRICEDLEPESVTLIQFDSRAEYHEVVESGDTPELARLKSGGTRFKAPFDYAEREDLMDDFDVIILFTDGGADDYPDEPDCPVIWASTGAFWKTPPFGEVIHVNL